MLLEDCEASRKPVAVSEPHFPVFSQFRDASYAARYEELCVRLLRERLYDACCLLLCERDGGKHGVYSTARDEIGPDRFIRSLLGHAHGQL